MQMKREEFVKFAEELRKKKESQEQLRIGGEFKRLGPQGQIINKIPPPPDTFCVYFLGGPKNGTQEFLSAKENTFIRDGKIGQFMDDPDPIELDEQGKIKEKPISCYEYQFDFLQLSRSKWLPDHQIVLAVFIG